MAGDDRPPNAVREADAYGVRLGLGLVKGIGEEVAERLDAELDRGPYRSLEDVVARTELSEEVIERLIRAGALDSLGRPRRELLWQLREVAGATKGSSTPSSTGVSGAESPARTSIIPTARGTSPRAMAVIGGPTGAPGLQARMRNPTETIGSARKSFSNPSVAAGTSA